MAKHRADCERAFACLVGNALSSVVYLGAWATAPWEPGAYVEWAELTTIAGARYRITTEADFGDYGLVIQGGAVDRSEALKVFDATGSEPWKRIVGRRIVGVRVYWRPLAYLGGAMPGEAPEYPRDVLLTFESGELVALSAASIGQDGEVVLGVDSVAALGEEAARGLGIVDT